MKPSTILITIFAGLVAAAPAKNSNSQGTIEELQATFERNNPNGVSANSSPDDLNEDGVINAFEENAQVAKRQRTKTGGAGFQQLQGAFGSGNPKGVAQPGSPDDLNSDGFINLFEGNAAVGRSVGKGVAQPGSPDDLNGDGFINLFEGNAAVGK